MTRGDFWPDPLQELLLRVAVGSQNNAEEALASVVDELDLEGPVAGETMALLPMFYRRLKHEGWSHPRLAVLKGVYLRSWYANRLAFSEAAQLLQVLEREGIRTMVLKGAVLAIDHYRDVGARPMGDVDVMVPFAAREDAINSIEAKGWIVSTESQDAAVHVVSPQGVDCDLHWTLPLELQPQEGPEHAGEDFWAAAIEFELEGVPTLRPNPADLLVHVCAHGARRLSGDKHITWLADTAFLLRSSDIEWDRVFAQSEKRHCVLALRDTLRYERRVLDCRVTDLVLGRFEAARPSVRDRLDYAAGGVAQDKDTTMPKTKRRMALYMVSDYVTRNRYTGWAKLVAGFPSFVRDYLGLRSVLQVPYRVVRRALQRNATDSR